jgi:hypothetical protein
MQEVRCQLGQSGHSTDAAKLASAGAFLVVGLLVLELIRLAGGCRGIWLIGWGLEGASVAGL